MEGFAKGAPVVSGDTGTQKTWTVAVDVDQWGAGSPAINDLGAQYYLWRTAYRNFGHYDENTANFNCKNWRAYGRNPDTLNSPQYYPDMYMSVSNQRLTWEDDPAHPIGTPNQDFTRAGQPGGSADAVAQANIIAFDGGVPGTPDPVTFNNWYSEEFVLRSNQNVPAASPPQPDPTSVLWNWYVEGKLSNQPAFPTPVNTYQWNQWYMKGGGNGRIMRYIFLQYIIDGTAGRSMIPVGSYIGFGPTAVDDSWGRAHIRNGAVRSAYSVTEYQPYNAWSDTSVTFVQRKGRLASYSGKQVIITGNSGTEFYAGDYA